MTKFIEVVAPGIYPMAIPSTAIKSIEKNDDGSATVFFNSDYSVKHPKGGYFGSILSVKSYDHVMATLNHTPPEPLILDLSKAEQDKIRQTLKATQRTLDEIQPRLQSAPAVGIESDVLALIRLLKDREYAEHWATSALGADLEEEITKLVGHDNAAASRLQRAEELLAEIHHAVNNDGGLYPIGPDSDLVARLSEYLYPAQ